MKTKTFFISALLFLVINSVSFAQWFPVSSGTTENLNGIYMLPSGVGYAVGNTGTIVKTTDTGNSWTPLTSGTTNTLNDVYFFDDNTGVAVGDAGLVLRTTNGGSNWSTIVVPSIGDRLLSVSFSGTNGIVGAESQTILYSTDSGASWLVSQSGFFGGGFLGAYMLNSTTGFVSGQNSIFQPFVAKSTDGGANWSFYNFYFQSNEGSCDDIHFFDSNTGVITGAAWNGQGAIARTTDSGSNWTTTLFPSIVALQGMDFPMANRGYAVGWAGTILNTTDSGISWVEQTSGISSDLYDVSFIPNTNTGVAVGFGGVIMRTDNGGVPVELVSFIASVTKNDVSLTWSTATETNNSGFNVERKNANADWEEIGFVPGYGTTTEPRSYSFNDAGLNSGTYTYRLKQIDFDGSFEYSNEVEVEIANLVDYSLSQNYPNPFNPSTRIEFIIPNSEMVNVSVYNSLGQKVADLVNEELSAGQHSIDFNAQGLASGIYIVKMKAGNFTDTRKMSLMK
jgi:photosystem II stability/assembly factor-like uncharacterized protein